jgi:hypothetical protein
MRYGYSIPRSASPEASMKSAIAFLFLSLCITLPCAAADFAGEVLAAHNAERTTLNLPPLVWNETLAAHAAVWANRLADLGRLEHSPRDARDGEGENLWMGTARGYTPEEMVGSWAQEKQFFVYGTFPDATSSGGHVVGHYTQMIWRGTTEVGCAMASKGNLDVLVCRYSPAGNMIGERPY